MATILKTSPGQLQAPAAFTPDAAAATSAKPSFWDQVKARPPLDVAGILRQTFNGVYRQDGRQIGSFQSMADLCAGRWLVFKGETALPISALYIKTLGGRLLDVPTACAQESYGIPAGASPAQRQAITTDQAKRQKGPLASLPVTLPSLPALPDLGGDNARSVSTIALWGALGLAGVLLLTASPRRRRR